ncbi:MAG: DNA primase regulatory subunit PriL [Methanolinea sp.]|jgi:DNA primase large subunit|nr:DNA primase regulatory subunit PriL [Methanolinea sp.]
MRISLETRDFAKYPFLKESQQFMLQNHESVDRFLQSSPGKVAIRYAVERVQRALSSTGQPMEVESIPLPSDNLGIRLEVSSYALSRVLVSCGKERALIDRLTRYEAQRAYAFLEADDEARRDYVASQVGFSLAHASLPVSRYVEVTAGMKEERWRLVNREVQEGRVTIEPLEAEELLKEQIRVTLLSQLPLEVPQSLCSELVPYVTHIQDAFQQKMLEDFGEVDESCFPPCMQAITAALSGGMNITHSGRFALTAFLHNIGMDSTQIIELYCRAPDFDVSKTQYQVEHISGRGGTGTEYTAPSCAAMRTLGLCVRPDASCERVNHPLNYYRSRKKGKKPGPN